MGFQHIETLHNPTLYGPAQLQQAYQVAQHMNRGKLVLAEPPR